MSGIFDEPSAIYVKCISCKEPMTGVTCANTRDTCTNCGGFSKVANTKHKRSLASLDALIRKYPYNKAKR